MKLTLILGTMFSGKSAYGIEHYGDYTWYVPEFTYRGYLTRDADLNSKIMTENNRVNFFQDFLPPLHDKMVIDEGQFLNDVNIDNIINCNEDYHIVIIALNSKGYVRGNHDEWQQVSNLISHASELVFLKASCSVEGCEETAVTHLKLPSEAYIGSDQYKVLCHLCLAEIRKKEEELLLKLVGDLNFKD